MNRKAFGDRVDIHGGGRDLIFPHYENEIAQSEALTGKPFANFWIHNGLIKVNGQKMSKSLGNSLLLKDLLDKYSPETIKFALLKTNYRGDINVTDDLFPEAEKHLCEFYKTIALAEEKGIAVTGGNKAIDDGFNAAMDDDFNTALAISDLYGYFKVIKAKILSGDKSAGEDISQIKKTYSLLGLFEENAKDFISAVEKKRADDIPKEITDLAEKMQAARTVKDYAAADALRAEINQKGYNVAISKDGVTITRKQK